MSKIALSGNASGTGTLTIAAPNTNSDRTLTLPDAAGTVFVSGQALSATTGSFSGDVTLGSSVLATPSGSAPSYTCRAWVNFNGTGTVAIRASGNVSSITDVGTGVYQINMTTAMPDTSFATLALFGEDSGSTGNGLYAFKSSATSLSTSAQRVVCGRPDNGALADASYVSVAIFR